MSNWQPIETAPRGAPLMHKDGPTIEVMWDGYDGVVGTAYFGWGMNGMGPRWNDLNGLAMMRPSFWRPCASLPSAPEVTS